MSLLAFPEDDELHPDLQKYLHDMSRPGMKCVQHPLVYVVPYLGSKVENGMANAALQHKQAAVQRAIKLRDIELYLSLHERPHRLAAFQTAVNVHKIVHAGSFKYWRHLAWMWRDSENIWENRGTWQWLFRQKHAERFMTRLEQRALDDMFTDVNDVLLVYRGGHYDGLSYTRSREVAEKFCRRCSIRSLQIRERYVQRHEIIAYTNARNEEEIILKEMPK